MDPHFRTINGFQSLVQKEWVTLGHAFTKRFGRVSEYENQQSPLFQLFLDCVWQVAISILVWSVVIFQVSVKILS